MIWIPFVLILQELTKDIIICLLRYFMLSLPKLKILNFSVHYVVLHDSDSNFYITIISEEVAQLVIGF